MKRLQDNETTGQQDNEMDLDRKREYHYETIDKCWHCKGTGKVTVTPVRKFMGRVSRKKRPAASVTAAVV